METVRATLEAYRDGIVDLKPETNRGATFSITVYTERPFTSLTIAGLLGWKSDKGPLDRVRLALRALELEAADALDPTRLVGKRITEAKEIIDAAKAAPQANWLSFLWWGA